MTRLYHIPFSYVLIISPLLFVLSERGINDKIYRL